MERACDLCHYDIPVAAETCPQCGGNPRANTTPKVVYEGTTEPFKGTLQSLGTLPFDCPFVQLAAHSKKRAILRRMGGHGQLFQLDHWPFTIGKLEIGDVFDVGLSDDGFIAARYYVTENDCVLQVIPPEGTPQELELLDDVRFFWEGGRLWAIPTSKEGSDRCVPRFHDGTSWCDHPELPDAEEAGYTSGFLTKSEAGIAYMFWEGGIYRLTADDLSRLPMEGMKEWSIDYPAARFVEGVVYIDGSNLFYLHGDGEQIALPMTASRVLPAPDGAVLVIEPYFRPWQVPLGVLWPDGSLTQLSTEALGIHSGSTSVTFASENMLIVAEPTRVRAFRWADIAALPRVVAMSAGRGSIVNP
jgi:hypothetical protein